MDGAERKINESEHHFNGMSKEEKDVEEDKKLEEDIIEEFKEMKKLSGAS